MKSLQRFSVFIAIAILLTTCKASAAADEPLKTQVGQTMSATIYQHGIVAFKTSIKSLQDFYDELISKVNLNGAEIAEIKVKKEKLQTLGQEIESMDTPKLIRSIEIFAQEYLDARKYRDETDDEKRSEVVTILFKKCSVDFEKAQSKWLTNVENKWQEVYKNIPADELSKYKEYNEINRILPEIKRAEVKGPITLQFFQTMIRFFDYKDWKFLLEPQQKHKVIFSIA